MPDQLPLPTIQETFFQALVQEAVGVIRAVAARSTKPLIIQFSGGRDSMTLLKLVQEAGATHYVAAYMATGLEFPHTVAWIKQVCQDFGVELLVSNPSMHKGNLFKRIEQFRSFPNLGKFAGGGQRLWCCRDLKLRPQKKMLVAKYGKGEFFRLEGVRRFESNRRKAIYRAYANTHMRPDDEFKGAWEVYPILNFTDQDVLHYLESRDLPTIGLYNEFGVSGCSFCPFYESDIYRRVLAKLPNHYDRIIEWEAKLGTPAITGGIWMGDLKEEVCGDSKGSKQSKGSLENPSHPSREEKRTVSESERDKNVTDRTPCTMLLDGNEVPTCQVYGHFYLDEECYRCGEKEE